MNEQQAIDMLRRSCNETVRRFKAAETEEYDENRWDEFVSLGDVSELAIALNATKAFASDLSQTHEWTGAFSGNFDDRRNWAGGCVPKAGDNVVIPGPTPHVLSYSTMTVDLGSIHVLPGASIGVQQRGGLITRIDGVPGSEMQGG